NRVGVSISNAVAAPACEYHLAVYIAVGRLVVARLFPVESRLEGVRPPNLRDVIRDARQFLPGVQGSGELEAGRIQHGSHAAAPTGIRGDLRLRVAEDILIRHSQLSHVDLGWIGEAVGQVQ